MSHYSDFYDPPLPSQYDPPSPAEDFAPPPEPPKSMTIYLLFKSSATEEQVGSIMEHYQATGLVYMGDPIDRINFTVVPSDPSKHEKVSVPLAILDRFEVKP